MKVLFCCRPAGLNITGGERIQILSTARVLRKCGVNVDVTTKTKISLKEYDLVHIFSIREPCHTYEQARNAKSHNKPTALTPIYWNTSEFVESVYSTQRDQADKMCLHSLCARLKRSNFGDAYRKKPFYLRWFVRNIMSLVVSRRLLPSLPTRTKEEESLLRSKILLMADRILPNGIAEKNIMIKDFKHLPLDESKFAVIYNGIDPELFIDSKPDPFIQSYGIKDFVLCVARIERRKNQLRLIEAMKGEGIPLVLVGKSYDKAYLKQCRLLADKNVHFLGEIAHDRLPTIYAAAKVHALVSWYETPGLASLEAAVAGCNIVSTNRGPTAEYFGPYAWYCDPSDVRSIREAVLSAYYSRRRNELQREVLRHFTLESIAKETLRIYEELLEV